MSHRLTCAGGCDDRAGKTYVCERCGEFKRAALDICTTPTPLCNGIRTLPPVRLLICLGPCHGEFYLPLTYDDAIVCPNDRAHPVALYQSPSIHAGDELPEGGPS